MAKLSKADLRKKWEAVAAGLSGASDPIAHFTPFVVSLQQADSPETLGYFAGKLAKKHAGAANNLLSRTAVAFLKANRPPEAIAIAKSLIASGDPDGRHRILLSRAHAAAGDIDASIRALDIGRVTEKQMPVLDFACQVGISMRNWDLLAQAAARWVALSPKNAQARQYLSHALFEQARYQEAAEAYAPMAEFAPDDAGTHTALGRLWATAQDLDRARSSLEKAIGIDPNQYEALIGLCDIAIAEGRIADGLALARRATETEPAFPLGWSRLAKLSQGQLTDTERSAMAAVRADPKLHPEHLTELHFELANSYHKAGDFNAAYTEYEKGNALAARVAASEGWAHDPAALRDALSARARLFADYPFAPPTDEKGPYFIIGMPRSGTTLIESTLAAHRDLRAGGELRMMPALDYEVGKATSALEPAAGQQWLGRNLNRLRKAYLAAAPGDGLQFTDKMPTNFQSAGLIRALFPGARMVHVHRRPLETCFSLFRHQIARQWAWAHTPEGIADFYALYIETMRLWDDILGPGAILHLEFEALVHDPSAEIPILLDRLGLDFDEACLAPEKSSHTVFTPSAVQVRSPISADFLDSTSRYEDRLTPLRSALKDRGIDPDRSPFSPS
ncbi:tetratricopeptide repeat-containing sulfotransferase family protein [Parvularcula marina]|uniref:Sulfotransferase family protein n=1 Tax=Parvularcula marina TaxID=2292771 RepID=A0A371RHE6_9PROT|nr:tetratricopeptide repeat-containing sulfotransferase family protein [Parvularcula marina]RFB04877.1 sulfotransferase family protein [Parvularcula marina]